MPRAASCSLALLPLLLGLATPAAAEITSVSFTGKGRITYSNYDFVPPVGTPVTVSGSLNFADYAVPDRFTGTVSLSHLDEGQSFDYWVDGARISGDSGAVYSGARVSLLRGRVVGVSMYADYDYELTALSDHSFMGVAGFHSPFGIREWGGTWSLVPEPLSWTLMLTGFLCTGAAMRRQRREFRIPGTLRN